MKIIVATDSFKGSLSSKRTGEIFARVAQDFDIDVVPLQIADGGEGTLDAVVACGKYELKSVDCLNPLGNPIRAEYALMGKTAFIEMAKASGLTLIDYADGNAMITSTYGTGQLIADAVKEGATTILISMGGSATNDGGMGALAALGYEFYDKHGNLLKPIGKNLGKVVNINCASGVSFCGIDVQVLTDVDNMLVGDGGATKFYGAQKGATRDDIEFLEEGMQSYADVVESVSGVRLHDMRGAGAAGGLAGGLIAFLGAKRRSGIEAVLDVIGFDEYLKDANAVITGEGKLDDQSLHGKAVSGVCARARKLGVPAYAMVGISKISEDAKRALGLNMVCELSKYASGLKDSIDNAEIYAQKAAVELLSAIKRSVLYE